MNANCQLSDTLSKTVAPATTRTINNELEFLAFTLGNEEYGIDLEKVQELRNHDAVTRIANAPEFVKGVINLRGLIVPVIDLRIKFNLANPSYDDLTVVIILNVADKTIGMVVDSVSDVITLTPEQIKPTPYLAAATVANYMIGMGVLDQRMLILLDLDMLMSSDEVRQTEQWAA